MVRRSASAGQACRTMNAITCSVADVGTRSPYFSHRAMRILASVCVTTLPSALCHGHFAPHDGLPHRHALPEQFSSR